MKLRLVGSSQHDWHQYCRHIYFTDCPRHLFHRSLWMSSKCRGHWAHTQCTTRDLETEKGWNMAKAITSASLETIHSTHGLLSQALEVCGAGIASSYLCPWNWDSGALNCQHKLLTSHALSLRENFDPSLLLAREALLFLYLSAVQPLFPPWTWHSDSQ